MIKISDDLKSIKW